MQSRKERLLVLWNTYSFFCRADMQYISAQHNTCVHKLIFNYFVNSIASSWNVWRHSLLDPAIAVTCRHIRAYQLKGRFHNGYYSDLPVGAIQLTHSEMGFPPHNVLKIMTSMVLYQKQTFSQKYFHDTHNLLFVWIPARIKQDHRAGIYCKFNN
jgi:hypothetical protein